MRPTTLRTKDGAVLATVEAPEGASRADIIGLAKAQKARGAPGAQQSDLLLGLGNSLRGPNAVARQLKPGEQAQDVSAGRYLAEGAKRRAGDILATAGGALMPGAGALGLAGRVLASEAGQNIGDLATKQRVTPGYGLASQLVGEGVGALASPLLSPATERAFANRTVKALTAKLDELVPSWKTLPASAKGLYERAHGIGQRVLSQKFDTVLRGIKAAIPETHAIKLKVPMEIEGKVYIGDQTRNTRALIDDLPDLRKAGGKEYRQALSALADQLPDGVSPALDAVRSEYKAGAGWMEFAERGKFLRHERYDPAAAQAALDTWGKKTLLRRGLDDIAAIVRGPGATPIEPVKHSQFMQRFEGALVGGAAGLPLGIPHAIGGATGGVIAGGGLPRTTFRHVPLTGAQRLAGRLGKAGVAEATREAGRDLQVKERLPAIRIAPND